MNETGPKRYCYRSVKNVKHLKIQHYLTTQKNTAAMTSTPKIQIFQIQNPQNTPLIPVGKYAKSTLWDSSFKPVPRKLSGSLSLVDPIFIIVDLNISSPVHIWPKLVWVVLYEYIVLSKNFPKRFTDKSKIAMFYSQRGFS